MFIALSGERNNLKEIIDGLEAQNLSFQETSSETSETNPLPPQTSPKSSASSPEGSGESGAGETNLGESKAPSETKKETPLSSKTKSTKFSE